MTIDWKFLCYHEGDAPVVTTGDAISIGQTTYHVDGEGEEYPTGGEYSFEGLHRQALAALALHGQPFGFTWDDVDFLRQCARDEVNGTNGDVNQYAAHVTNAIADRIAALLPPREPKV